MKKKSYAIIGVLVVIIILIVASILIFNNNNNNSNSEVTELKTVNISVYDQNDETLFNENVETDKEYLIDVLNDTNELQLETEDSQYGAYITSIMGIEQNDDYYWSYYIDDSYATVGVSSCEVENGQNYSFKFEKIEY